MKSNRIWQDFLNLPAEAQQQVCDLITTLKQQSQITSNTGYQTDSKISEEPFIGIWKNREDLADSSQWVRRIRSQDWREELVNRGDN